MLQLIKRVIGLPVAQPRAPAALDLPRPDRATPARSSASPAGQVARHADSQFGRDHHFSEIRTAGRFPPPRPDRRLRPPRALHRPRPAGRHRGTLRRRVPSPDVRHDLGHDQPAQDDSRHAQSLSDYREGWTIWGIQAFDAHPDMLAKGLRPILQIASDWRESFTPAGIPCGAITGLTARCRTPWSAASTACRPAARGSRTSSRSTTSRCGSRSHRDLGTIIAANPSTILAMARLGDREKETLIRDLADGTIDREMGHSAGDPPALRFRTRSAAGPRRRRLEAIVDRTGRLLPKDYWPNLHFLSNWMGGTMRAYLRGYPEFFGDTPVRDVGLIASEGRMTIPIEDGTPAGILDIRHHYFEFIPEDQADAPSRETVEAADLIEGQNYFIVLTTAGGLYRYNIHDLVRCVGFHGQAPDDRVPEQRGALLQPDRREALGAPGDRRRRGGPGGTRPSAEVVPPAPVVGRAAVLLAPGRERRPGQRPGRRPPGRASRSSSASQNIEYASKRDTLRLGPVRTIRLPRFLGRISETTAGPERRNRRTV